MRWFSWQDDINGSPKMTWGVRNTGEATATMFNTLPLISGGTPAQIRAFLIGTAGTSLPEGTIPDSPQASIPDDGNIYYNNDRNTVVSTNANGFTISGRSQIGLAYASPTNYACHRTEYLHMQFMAIWPTTTGVTLGAKSCTINIYRRTN
jgi:hypothetical protein